MLFFLAMLTVPANLVQLATAQSNSTSIQTNESCLTKMSSTTAAPSPLSTVTTTGETETSTATLTVTVPEVVSASNAVVTKTNYNTITIRSANATVTGSTATVTNNAQTTVATSFIKTITATTTLCTGDQVSTVTVPSTTTVYSDAPSARKRHPNPFGATLHARQASDTAAGTNLPVEVVCTEQPTVYVVETLTVTSGTSTAANSAASTSTSIVNLYATRTIYFTTTSQALTTVTVTNTNTALAVLTETSTISTQCASSTVTGTVVQTVTRASLCAPAAMTSAAGKYDIVEVDDHPQGGAAGTTSTEDPSACCQLCLDTQDCAAAAHLPRTGNCVLEFTSPQSCGVGLYALAGHSEDGNQGTPGTGWWVQNGCGQAQVYT